MASSLIQIRIDEELKAEATALYEALGIDLPTAVRMFIKRSVLIQGIPLSMNLPSNEYKAYRSVQAIQELSEEALKNGVADMTIEEINEEISAARNDRDSLGGTTI